MAETRILLDKPEKGKQRRQQSLSGAVAVGHDASVIQRHLFDRIPQKAKERISKRAYIDRNEWESEE